MPLYHGDSKVIHRLHRWEFLNATNRLAGLQYVDIDHQAVAVTFSARDIGRRGYDLDTKTLWDITDVVAGVPTWVSGSIPPGGTTNQALTKISDADYDVHWSDVATGGGGLSITIATYSMTGVIPTVMGSITLPAGTYPAPKAKYGCGHTPFTSYLVLQDALVNQLVVFLPKVGGVTWATGPNGFTLPVETELDVMLYTNDPAESAFIHAFQF